MIPSEKTKMWELLLPLIGKLIWPIFILIMLFLSRDVIEAIKHRILMGSNIKVGQYFELGEIPKLDKEDSTITKITDEVREIEQKIEEDDQSQEQTIEPKDLFDMLSSGSGTGGSKGSKGNGHITKGSKGGGNITSQTELLPSTVPKTASKTEPKVERSFEHEKEMLKERYAKLIFITHGSSFDHIVKRRRYFRIKVETRAHDEETFEKIEKVVYHLHNTFKDPDREITNKDNNFALELTVWGEFTLYADVYIENLEKPIRIERYLDIKPAAAY